jgi:hypothetical protein
MSESPSQESVEAENKVDHWSVSKDSHFCYLKSEMCGTFMFPVTEFDQLDQVCRAFRSAIDKSRAAQPQDDFARVQELARQNAEMREALGIKIGTHEKVLEHIKILRAAQPQEWSDSSPSQEAET